MSISRPKRLKRGSAPLSAHSARAARRPDWAVSVQTAEDHSQSDPLEWEARWREILPPLIECSNQGDLTCTPEAHKARLIRPCLGFGPSRQTREHDEQTAADRKSVSGGGGSLRTVPSAGPADHDIAPYPCMPVAAIQCQSFSS